MYGYLTKWKKKIDSRAIPHMKKLAHLGVKPVHVTLISMIFGVTGIYYLFDNTLYSFTFLSTYFLLDVLDGTLARTTGQQTKLGERLDFTGDRLVVTLFLIKLYLKTGEIMFPAVGLAAVAFVTLDELRG